MTRLFLDGDEGVEHLAWLFGGPVSRAETLEEWYAAFPDPNREVAGRIRSERWEDFVSASSELYFFHRVRTRLGVEPEPHPDMDGSSRRPDFRVGNSLVEIVAVVGTDKANERLQRLAAELDKRCKSECHLVDLYAMQPDGLLAEIPPRKFSLWVQRFLDSLPGDESSEGRSAIWPDEDHALVRVEARYLAAVRNEGQGVVAGWVPRGSAQILSMHEAIRRCVDSKRPSQYGVTDSTDEAFVILVVGDHWAVRHSTFLDAMLGQRTIVHDRQPDGSLINRRASRSPGWLTPAPGTHVNTRVSAVGYLPPPLGGVGGDPILSLIKNPFARVDLDEHNLSADYVLDWDVVDDEKVSCWRPHEPKLP